MAKYKFGKLPARPGAVQLKMSDYVKPYVLPTPPLEFGHEKLVANWGMLKNDQIGDCVIAGGAHETMLWSAMGDRGKPVEFSDRSVESDYSAITGYSWWKPGSDRGTDMQEAARYRQRYGLRDRWGFRHKIGAYVSVSKHKVSDHALAAYLFGAVAVGVMCPETMMEQFEKGEPWTYVPGSKLNNGHYIPIVARRGGYLICVTWGRLQRIHPTFLEAYCDEALAYISPEMLKSGRTADGFDMARLESDLRQLQAR